MSVKFYVVWAGHTKGIYNNWEECKQQITGYEGALYKSFISEKEAIIAFKQNPYKYIGSKTKENVSALSGRFQPESLSVDAACSGNPGKMEYRGVHVRTKEVWFLKEFPSGTNNIGEFLAIVHGLAELCKRKINIPVYSDSQTALSWVKKKKCATKLPETDETKDLFMVIRRAEKWLCENRWEQELLKWDTVNWGEIPADFGRK